MARIRLILRRARSRASTCSSFPWPSTAIAADCEAVGIGVVLRSDLHPSPTRRRADLFADETRPFLQGARLTAWELVRENIPVTLITDNMAAHLMQRGEVDLVVVGADRVAYGAPLPDGQTYKEKMLAEVALDFSGERLGAGGELSVAFAGASPGETLVLARVERSAAAGSATSRPRARRTELLCGSVASMDRGTDHRPVRECAWQDCAAAGSTATPQ